MTTLSPRIEEPPSSRRPTVLVPSLAGFSNRRRSISATRGAWRTPLPLLLRSSLPDSTARRLSRRRGGSRFAGFELAENVDSPEVTIPYVGRCLGSGKPPREGTEESQGADMSGVCVACSGRFEVEHGTVVEHETAQVDERESVNDANG